MSKVNFEERAVAFIDVLGFKSIVENANKNVEDFKLLQELIEVLENAVPSLDNKLNSSLPKELIPRHIYISDCIILSAPHTSDKEPNYNGLSIIIMRVIQLTHILLSKGYLLRGGISVGQVWHSDSNIVGPAYQEAYLLETKTNHPRVVLSPSAERVWSATVEGGFNHMCVKYDDHIMVNGLHDYYIEDYTHGCAERAFQKYIAKVNSKISNIENLSAKNKWIWFRKYVESEILRNDYIVNT